MIITELRYGKETVALSMPDNVTELSIREPEVTIDKHHFVRCLAELLEKQHAPVSGNLAIIVADKTRLCGYERILPWVTETLEEMGAESGRIKFYIAYGTHPRQSDEECRNAYGESYDHYLFNHHDCHDKESFVSLGTTLQGTNVAIRRDVIEADLILTVGTVSHHYFAGYGGGRKLLFPGVAEKEAIYANHKLFLDGVNGCLATECWPGKLEGNPLAADLKEIHDLLPDYLSIHALLNSKGKPARYNFGSSYEDFLAVCRELDSYYKIDTDQQFDTVVVSAGGYPKDINIIQAHKAIHNAANLVKDGGKLVVIAECIDGVGSKTFLPYFRLGGWDNTFSSLSETYVGNGGTALAMMEKTNRIDIFMMTALSREVCSEIGITPCSMDDINRMLDTNNETVGLITNGSLLVSNRMT